MPLYGSVDGFVAVPSSNPTKQFSLPRGFAAEVARHTGKADLSSAVTKPNATPQMKNLSKAQKVEALLGSVTIDRAKVVGKTIVVVDDLYQSGLTVNYIAEELRAAGAKALFGLTVVKTLRDDDNVSKTAGGTPDAPSAQADDDDMDDEIPSL
jgi:predicted amidophosphoribosyltransferase